MADATLDEVVAGCKAGDERSFRKLLEESQPAAFRLAFRMLCDEDEARDAVQRAFINIWRGIGSYDPARSFKTWMFAIVSNVCLDALRERRRRGMLLFRPGHEVAADDPIVEDLSNRQLASAIRSLTGRLPAKQKLVFTLRDLEDLSVEEVVEITGLTRDAVKANLWHARQTIRKILEKREGVKEDDHEV